MSVFKKTVCVLALFGCMGVAYGDFIFYWDVKLDNGQFQRFSFAQMVDGESKTPYCIADSTTGAKLDGMTEVVAQDITVDPSSGEITEEGTYTGTVTSYLAEKKADIGTSFYVELFDKDLQLIGSTALYQFADYNVFDTSTAPGGKLPSGSSAITLTSDAFHTVPEPTSGLLLLLGLAAVGLKRKRL